MKWLKLDCDFQDDPKIKCLSREWGGEAAVAFWTSLLAFVGRHGGTECRVKIDQDGEYSAVYLASRLSTKPQVALRRLSRAAQLGLICRESWENDRVIFLPNMLKRLDDYTRKVRTKAEQSPKVPHTEEEIEKEVDIEEEGTNTKALLNLLKSGFESVWNDYPAKDGKRDAEKHFAASVKTEQDLLEIRLALTKYKAHLKVNPWKRPKSGKTWFYNWRDWVNWVEPAGGSNGTAKETHADRVARENRETAALFGGELLNAASNGDRPESKPGAGRALLPGAK